MDKFEVGDRIRFGNLKGIIEKMEDNIATIKWDGGATIKYDLEKSQYFHKL